MNKEILDGINSVIKEVKCPLNYNHDYELLIAVMLSSQTTDITVNKVTNVLFSKYDLTSLANAKLSDIEAIVRPCGMKRKASSVISIASRLLSDCNGIVPNNRRYLESLPGIGRKSTNVVLSELFDEPYLAVDTHILRVAKRLGIADINDSVLVVEEKLTKYFAGENYRNLHLKILLFGRNICTSKNPKCDICPLNKICKKKEYK